MHNLFKVSYAENLRSVNGLTDKGVRKQSVWHNNELGESNEKNVKLSSAVDVELNKNRLLKGVWLHRNHTA